MKKILAILAAVLLAAPGAAQAAYNYTSVDYPGAYATQLFGINDRGDVVGRAFVPGGTKISFLYDPRTKLFTVLPNVSGYNTGSIGVNDYGVVVGEASDQNGGRGFILDKGAFTLFDHPGFSFTEARGVNNLGVVAGFARNQAHTLSSGFIYDPESNTLVDFLPSVFTIAHGINNLGDVVGNGNYAPGFPGRWGLLRLNTSAITLFRVNGLPTRARGINDRGQIAGDVFDFSTATVKGFVTSKSGVSAVQVNIPVADLLDYPGARQTQPQGISNSGVVVGIWIDADGFNHGFIATPSNLARASHTPLPDSVISYWTFDDGTAVDIAGGNDGTLYGAASVPGKVGKSMFFDGYSAIHMPNAPVFGSGDFTVAFWGKDSEPLSGVEGIFSTTEGSPWTQAVLYGGDWAGIDSMYTHLPSEGVCAADTFGRTEWSFIVLRRSGDVFEWIINGALSATCYDWPAGGSWDSSHPELGMRIGSSRPSYLEEPLTGYVDELAFFSRALTDAEIQQFYENSLAGRGYGWTALRDIKALVAAIAALNLENSLDRKLAGAEAALTDLRQGNDVAARNKLATLLHEINAQRGTHLSTEEAALLTDMTQQVINGL